MCSASVLGGFWTYFLRESGTRIKTSTLTFLPEEVAALDVDNSSGPALLWKCVLAGYAGTEHLVLCSPRMSAGWEEKCAQSMLQLLPSSTWNLDAIFTSPSYLTVIGVSAAELFELSTTHTGELSRARGCQSRREFYSQVTRHRDCAN